MRASAMREVIAMAKDGKGSASDVVNQVAEGVSLSGVRIKTALEAAGYKFETKKQKFTVVCSVFKDDQLVGSGTAGNESEAVLCAVRGMVYEEYKSDS